MLENDLSNCRTRGLCSVLSAIVLQRTIIWRWKFRIWLSICAQIHKRHLPNVLSFTYIYSYAITYHLNIGACARNSSLLTYGLLGLNFPRDLTV